jgi:hypothetical protein
LCAFEAHATSACTFLDDELPDRHADAAGQGCDEQVFGKVAADSHAQ